MVLERSAGFYRYNIWRIRQQMQSVRDSNFTAEEKQKLYKIYTAQLAENEQKLASFSKAKSN